MSPTASLTGHLQIGGENANGLPMMRKGHNTVANRIIDMPLHCAVPVSAPRGKGHANDAERHIPVPNRIIDSPLLQEACQ
jgi:hypothetical protein